ncbi:reverse transcriptase domain-containing protein [Tanacetum coccineum]
MWATIRVGLNYGQMDDNATFVAMIGFGIPLDEPYLQRRISILTNEERKGLRGGKIPVDDNFYLIGTTDPTGTLESDEVCVILENRQVSGKVLVYRNLGVHFGDIHILNENMYQRSRRLEDRSITKEKVRKERSKSRRKRSGHQEASSNSEYEEGSEDAYEDLNSPYKRPKPAPFTQIITRFKYHRRAKLPRNMRVYKGNKDPEDHLGIFSAAAEQEEWPMPIWCKMFRQTLGRAARNWFDDLGPKSVDSFEEVSHKFLEEFSQQKRYAKDPTEIHGIKRRQNEGLQGFIDRFKSEISHIKGVPPILRISAFMHGHGHSELAKKLNDKIPKTVDETFERVRAFIREKWPLGH